LVEKEAILFVVGIFPLEVNASLVSPAVVVDVVLVILVVVEKPFF
jgi:hypothetical protein